MSKRFIDTNYFNDPFILSLKPEDKLLYIYLWTICDHAGIFEMNEELGNFHLKCKNYKKRLNDFLVNQKTKLAQLSENHFILLNYCKQQYPGGVNTNVRQISGAIKILNDWNIEIINTQTFTLRVNNTLKPLESLNKAYGNDNGNVNDNVKKFTPPTLEQVKEYFKEKGYTEQTAIKAFEYYNTANWHDSRGKPVKNWKQKMISVWFKPENKEQKGRDLSNYEYT